MYSSNYPSRFGGYASLLSRALVVLLALLSSVSQASAQQDVISPGRNIEAVGVPPVPASLARDLSPYSSVYGLPLAGWDFEKHEILLKGISNTTWISRVSSPGAKALPTLIYIPSNGIYDVYFQPQGKYLAYTRDTGGNETFQLYLYQIGRVQSTMLSDGKSRNTEPVWSNAGDRIVYSSTPIGDSGVNLRLIDPFKPDSDRLIAKSSGSYFKAYDWSPDDKQIVFCDFTSNTASTLWLLDAATGNKTLLSPKSDSPELYDYPQFSKDGKGVYVLTDHDSDMRRVAYIDLMTHRVSYVASSSKWDVDEFQLAPDGKTLAYITNEDGISRLHLLEIAAGKERATPQLPVGVISDLKWNKKSTDLAFNFKSPRTPNDVYSVNVETGRVELWSKGGANGVDTETFSSPELIHCPTSGYEDNYFLDALGVAKIYPNVRGSSGYGKAFLALDNGFRREDAVKDMGALLDWIKAQPDLDADRVLVQGVSYGGYLALTTAYAYPDRIRGAISESGITDLASFVEHTEGWRRGLQRSEFGDERDPKVREFLERVAPLNNAQNIKKPLLIIHGQNDPRVPVAEANALVAATKDRIPVWYILAKDEGHGLVQRSNRNYRLYASILFVKEFLLK